MGAPTTTATYGSMADKWAHRALIQRPKPRNVHNLFGLAFNLPQKNTRVMNFRRQENLNSDPAVLTEGVDPAPESLLKNDIDVQVQEFGKLVLLSRTVTLTVEDDTARGTADNLNQCMHTMLDKVTRDVWDSAVSQIDCVNGVNGNAITELNLIDWNRAVAYLDGNDTEKVAPIIEGSNKYGTQPVEESYWATVHVDLKPDLRAISEFVPKAQYGSVDPTLQAEFGAIQDVRIVNSTLVKKDTSSPPVYNNTMVGANAYGYVTIDEVSTEMIMKPLGWNDYLNRNQSMGFTAWFNAVILDDRHIVNLRSTKAA